MTDHFAVLGQPRRPWIDPDQLKTDYQKLALDEHPDRKKDDTNSRRNAPPGPTPPTLAEVNEAYRVLSNPRLRLQHLMSLDADSAANSEAPDITTEFGDVFMKTAELVHDIDVQLQKRESASSALGKSLLQPEVQSCRDRADALLQQLESLYADAMQQLRKADQVWMTERAHVTHQLGKLAQRFGYLERWIGQLREKQFQLLS